MYTYMCISTYNTYVYIRAQVKRLHLLEYERRGRQYPHELVVSVAMPTATGMRDADMTFRGIYVYICMYTCVYTHVYVYVCMHVCMHVCMYVCIYMYEWINMSLYQYMYVYMCICI